MKPKTLAILLLALAAIVLYPGCTQAELESGLRAANAGLGAYYGTPAPAPEPRVTINPPGAPYPLYP